MSDAAVSVYCNVTIRCIDRHGKVIRTVERHNKATANMVDGLLRFLKGDFNPTEYNQNNAAPSEATPYLPVRAQFGRVGVKLTEGRNPPVTRNFDYMDSSEFVQPTYNTMELQEPISYGEYTTLRFGKVRQEVFLDPNNSSCLKFSLYINPGKLVGYEDDEKGFIPYDWSYWNPNINQYEAMFTEVGLFSSTNLLLARVLFDGEVTTRTHTTPEGVEDGTYPAFVRPNNPMNPVTQSQDTTIVLEWRVGIISIGDNDEFVTQNNLTNDQMASKLADWIVKQYSLDETQSTSQVKSDIMKKINELTNNSSIGGK